MANRNNPRQLPNEPVRTQNTLYERQAWKKLPFPKSAALHERERARTGLAKPCKLQHCSLVFTSDCLSTELYELWSIVKTKPEQSCTFHTEYKTALKYHLSLII